MNLTSRYICVILLFNLSGIVLGQDTLGRFSVGISAAPNFSYRTLVLDATEGPGEQYYQTFRNREQAKIGYSATLDFGVKLTENVSLITGFSFNERGYKMSDQVWWDEYGIQTLGSADIEFHISYLALPIKFELEKEVGSFSIFTSAGVGLEYRVRNSFDADVEYHEYLNWENEKLTFQRGEEPITWFANDFINQSNKFAVYGLLDLGIRLSSWTRGSISISPTFAYSFNSLFLDPIKEMQYNIGLNIGARYNLK
jgi:hypothetical protein